MTRLTGLRVTPDRATGARLRETGREPPVRRSPPSSCCAAPTSTTASSTGLGLGDETLGGPEREQVEVLAKYASYIEKQGREVERIRRLEDWPIPAAFHYAPLTGLKREAAEKLARFRPATVGPSLPHHGRNPSRPRGPSRPPRTRPRRRVNRLTPLRPAI